MNAATPRLDGIFISYRRDDSAGYAGRLYDRLAAQFGASRVFMDVEGIEPGVDFVSAIERAVASCRVLLVVIGDEWVHSADAAGRRRLDDPNDFVRLEVVAALARDIRVVPVLVGGAQMPRAEELPAGLGPLTRRQAHEVLHKQWEASVGELVRALERMLEPAVERPALPASRPPPPPPPQARVDVDTKPPWSVPRSARITAGVATLVLGGAGAWWAMLRAPAPGTEASTTAPASAPATPTAPSTGQSTAQSTVAPAPPQVAEISTSRPASGTPPASAAATAPAATSPPGPAPLAVEQAGAPVIESFRAEPGLASARLCFRVRDAATLRIDPRPGQIDRAAGDCVRVPIDTATTFTLTARHAGGAEATRSLSIAPRAAAAAPASTTPASPSTAAARSGTRDAGTPVRTATAPPASTPSGGAAPAAAADTPSSVTSPTADGPTSRVATLPVAGERWVYRLKGKWRTSPSGSFEVVAPSVGTGRIDDEIRPPAAAGLGGAELRRATPGPTFVHSAFAGLEFAPYLGAFAGTDRLVAAGTQRGVATPDFLPSWRGWLSEVTPRGTEAVTVPAGRYDARRMEVWSTRSATGGPAQVQIEPVRVRQFVWYAPQVPRYVKLERWTYSPDGSEIEHDLIELVSHHRP